LGVASMAMGLSLGGCTFNSSTQADLGDGALPIIDGGPSIGTRPDAIAPEDCPEDIRIEVRVGGRSTPLSQGGPFLRTLIGDTVELSAAGTCTRSGIIQYRWIIEPGTSLIEETALPDLFSETITVYSRKPEQHTVRLEVGDGTTTKDVSIFAFEAHGFEELASYDGNNIRDLSAGADFLWVGADDAAYRGNLPTPNVVFPIVNTLYAGDTLPSKLHVHETSDGSNVWFGSEDADGRAYVLDLATSSISSFATLPSAKTRDIDDAEMGVRYATDKGVALALDSQTFAQERGDDTVAVSYGPTGSWAGKAELYPLPNGDPIDLFGGNDDIQALDDDGTLLWIASDSDGVVTFAQGAIQASYTENNSNLPSNDVETIDIDLALDVWVGTSQGVSRFKRDRQVWVPLVGDSGLGGSVNIDAIAVDESNGRRAVYVGSDDRLFLMKTP